jgi:hypothetical protein
MRLAASASMATVERPIVKIKARMESKCFIRISFKSKLTQARIKKRMPMKKKNKQDEDF